MTQNDHKFLMLGILLGGSFVYNRMKKRQTVLINRYTDDCNLRTDLLNWIVDVGITLEEEEFYEEYQVRAKFINLVT